MKNTILLLLHLQLCLLTYSQYCTGSYAFEYSDKDCIFDYTYTDPTCTDFSFLQCTWVECVHWKQVGNDTVCDQTDIFYDYSWNYCTRQCCGNSASYPDSYSSIGDCQAYLDEQHRLGLIIVGSILGGLVLIFGVWICCKGGAGKCDCGNSGECVEGCLKLMCCLCCLCLKGSKHHHNHEHHRHHDKLIAD